MDFGGRMVVLNLDVSLELTNGVIKCSLGNYEGIKVVNVLECYVVN